VIVHNSTQSGIAAHGDSYNSAARCAGSYAVNPVNKEAVPIWVADYVLGSYGSGAIMAVPAHDTRDFDFAQEFGLPVCQVVQNPGPSQEQRLPFIGQHYCTLWVPASGIVDCQGGVERLHKT